MKAKKKLPTKEKANILGRILSEPDISKAKHRSSIKDIFSTTESFTPEQAEELRSDHRQSLLLNLQIPNSPCVSRKLRKTARLQRIYKSPKARPSHEALGQPDDKTADMTKMNREKNRLLAKITALQQEIFTVKTENKRLKNNTGGMKALEKLLIEAHSENKALKREKPAKPNWHELEHSMEDFKDIFCKYLQHK